VALAVEGGVLRQDVAGTGVAGGADERDAEERAGEEKLAGLVVPAGRGEAVLGHAPRDRDDRGAGRGGGVEERAQKIAPARVRVGRPPQVEIRARRGAPYPVHVERDLYVGVVRFSLVVVLRARDRDVRDVAGRQAVVRAESREVGAREATSKLEDGHALAAAAA